jgi:hypothetical protein
MEDTAAVRDAADRRVRAAAERDEEGEVRDHGRVVQAWA